MMGSIAWITHSTLLEHCRVNYKMYLFLGVAVKTDIAAVVAA